MKAKKLISIVLVVLTVLYCGIACLCYDESSSVQLLCVSGTEGEAWAKRHHADYRLLSETELETALLHLSTFDYNLTELGCVIMGSHTTSQTVVIPDEIDGVPVAAVHQDAFQSSQHVTAVYVPETVLQFVPLHTDQYAVHCYRNSPVCIQLQQAESERLAAEQLKKDAAAALELAVEAEQEAQRCVKAAEEGEATVAAAQEAADAAAALAAEEYATAEAIQEAETLAAEAAELAAAAKEGRALADAAEKAAEKARKDAQRLADKVESIPPETFVVCRMEKLLDSDPINFDTANIPFSYNHTGSGLELTAYTGDSSEIIVPASIDGVPVTAISFPVEVHVRSILLPGTVTEIRSPLTQPRYDALFFCNLALVLLGLVIALTATAVAAKRGTTAERRFLGVALIYSGIKYFVLLLIWAAVSLIYGFSIWVMGIVGIALMAIALIEVTAAGTAGKTVAARGDEVRQKTLFIRAYRAKAENLEARAPEALKAECEAVTEAFRYADPMSHDGLTAVEEEIAARFETFSAAVLSGNPDAAKPVAKELLALLEERNRTCRMLK